MKKYLGASVGACLTVLACSAQTGNDYKGEPLASISGSLVTIDGHVPGPTDVALVWSSSRNGNYREFGQILDVESEFPASFTMDLLTPPPRDALNESLGDDETPTEAAWGIGFIIAVPEGRIDDVLNNYTEDAPPITGFVGEYAVAYFDRDLASDSELARRVGGAYPAGYHLFRVIRATEEELRALDACYEEADRCHEAVVDCYKVGADDSGATDTSACDAMTCEDDCGSIPLRFESVAWDTPITLTVSQTEN